MLESFLWYRIPYCDDVVGLAAFVIPLSLIIIISYEEHL